LLAIGQKSRNPSDDIIADAICSQFAQESLMWDRVERFAEVEDRQIGSKFSIDGLSPVING